MPSVFVYAPSVEKPIKIANNNILLHYDSEQGKMLEFKGGRLAYDYVYDAHIQKNKVVPRAIETESYRTAAVKDITSVDKWFEEFTGNRLHSQAERLESNNVEGWIEFDVPAPEVREFTEELEYVGFDFRVI